MRLGEDRMLLRGNYLQNRARVKREVDLLKCSLLPFLIHQFSLYTVSYH